MPVSSRVKSLEQYIDMEQTEHDLREQAARFNTRKEYIAWEQQCDEFIESLNESELNIRDQSILNSHWLLRSRGMEGLKDLVRGRFVHARGHWIQCRT